MSRLRDRLIAGEHIGCSSWREVAQKLKVDERHLRVIRATLTAEGRAVRLERSGSDAEISMLARGVGSESTAESDPCPATGSGQPDCIDIDVSDLGSLSEVVPPKHAIKGVSTLLDADGSIRQQWVKTTAQNDERAEWLDAVRSLADELPRVEPVEPPAASDDDLLVVLPVGDPHVGLLSWHEDAGENFDLEIAERNLVAAFQNLIARAPSAAHCLLIFIGDNTHADGQNNTTTKGTRVDVDGRTVKMVRTSLNVIRQAIALALTKFGSAHVIIERGNHDELLSAMTALALGMFYENEPRVTVDQSPEMYHFYRFGQCLIGTHHGDRAKPEQLLGVMAVDRQQDWGETSCRRFYLGHYHHQIVKEVPGLICEYLPTLAGADAWHRGMGYRAQRAMYMDVFHRDGWHQDRCIVGIKQLRAA